MSEDNRKHFHHQIDDLRASIVQLAARVTETIPRATRALLDGDLAVAQSIIDGDDVIDAEALSIEERCLSLMALQQPMASDLREVVTALKLDWEIERAGDLAVNIAKSTRRLYGGSFTPRLRGLTEQMGEEAFRLSRLAVDAYVENNIGLASALDDMDDRLDRLQIDFIAAIIETHDAGQITVAASVQLAMVARWFERIGDHAVNMGERVQYLVTGWLPEHTGAARIEARGRAGGATTTATGGA